MYDRVIKKDPVDPYESTVVDIKGNRDAKNNLKSNLKIVITVIQGKEMDFAKSFSFNKKNIIIGRNKNNDISINDEKISKIHCEINVISNHQIEQIVIVDLNSTNGTYVNGESINQKSMKSGDKIEIGDTVLRLSYDDDIEREYHTKLFDFAAKDSLTELYNKRYIINELENQIKIAKRNKRVFSLVIFDIDNFKNVNDVHGHLAGDEILKKIASILKDTLREQDISGRIGGEEFLTILPETTVDGAFILANRVRKRVEEFELIFHKSKIKITISAGISQFELHSSDITNLFKMADNALYKAKKSGKNKVIRAYFK